MAAAGDFGGAARAGSPRPSWQATAAAGGVQRRHVGGRGLAGVRRRSAVLVLVSPLLLLLLSAL